MEITTLAALLMASVAAGAAALLFIGRDATALSVKRVRAATGRIPASKQKASIDPSDKRRKQVAETLKNLDKKAAQQKIRPTLKQAIEQAGLTTTPLRFHLYSACTGLVVAFFVLIKGAPLYIVGAAAIAAGLGLPRWVLKFLAARRQKNFINEFANAIDIIVRGVKSGLPLNDCLKVIGSESPDPVGGEFRLIIENLRVGVTLDDSLKRFLVRVPLPEVNFFQIVLSIQQKSGGNLSEALGNLSGLLRERKRLQGKIKALSSEAKASAAIIGSLPVAVMTFVYVTTPDYIAPLFNTRHGLMLLGGCAVWMSLGVLIMNKMIKFKH